MIVGEKNYYKNEIIINKIDYKIKKEIERKLLYINLCIFIIYKVYICFIYKRKLFNI